MRARRSPEGSAGPVVEGAKPVTRITGRLGLGLAIDQREDFVVVLGKALELVLGEDELAVLLDVVDAPAATDQRGVDAVPVLDRGRQTGGPGFVVSDPAVRDLERKRLRSGHVPSRGNSISPYAASLGATLTPVGNFDSRASGSGCRAGSAPPPPAR